MGWVKRIVAAVLLALAFSAGALAQGYVDKGQRVRAATRVLISNLQSGTAMAPTVLEREMNFQVLEALADENDDLRKRIELLEAQR